MPGFFSVTYQDYSHEYATVGFPVPTITAANLAGLQADIVTLITAAEAISLGTMRRRQLTHEFAGSGAVPTDQEAQREEKWLVGYIDVSATLAAGVNNPMFGKSYTVTIPTAELTDHLSTNSDYADLSEPEIDAFVTAFEAFARSPSGGAVNVQYIKFVGRNH